MFEDFKTKKSLVIVYTGENKGKTSASLGQTIRALGSGWSVAYIQFIKYWKVSEHQFFEDAKRLYGDKLYFFKGGKGFYKAERLSAKGVSDKEHKLAAVETFKEAQKASRSGKYQLVVCDEINNAVHDGLLEVSELEELINQKHRDTSLCLTGRHFPDKLIDRADIATEMLKLKHHYDDKFLANPGLDY